MITTLKNRVVWILLAALFAWVVIHVIQRDVLQAEMDTEDRIVIRVAMGDGRVATKEGMQALAEDYMKLHPNTLVKLNMVPDKVYLQFLRTQISGGNPPDIMQIAGWLTGMEEMRNRHFVPLTEWVTQRNPYNEGTELETLPWAETYIDGLSNPDCYSAELRNYFGVALMMSTVRIFYNQDLLETITGKATPPESFDELMEVCAQIEDYAADKHLNLVPFAGSRNAGIWIMSFGFSAINQRLYQELDNRRTLSVGKWDYPKAYLRGQWSFESESIRAGYELMRDWARYHKSGFMQLNNGDALFQFAQRDAVMFTTQTKDAASIISQLDFPVGAFPIPVPSPAHPEYGRFVMGPISESFIQTGQVLGVLKSSAHQQEAIRFLQFLSSRKGNEKFARLTGWLPAIRGAALPPGTEGYRPMLLGYPGRFAAEMVAGGDTRFHINQQLYLLFSPHGGVEAFCEKLGEIYGPGMWRDLDKYQRDVWRNVNRQTPAIVAAWRLSHQNSVEENLPENPSPTSSWGNEFWERLRAQNESETEVLQTRYILWKHPAP